MAKLVDSKLLPSLQGSGGEAWPACKNYAIIDEKRNSRKKFERIGSYEVLLSRLRTRLAKQAIKALLFTSLHLFSFGPERP